MMAKRRLGIFLGRAGAEAAFVELRRRGAYKVLASVRLEADGPLWTDEYKCLKPLFRQLAKKLPHEARRADVCQHISLPDPLVSEDRLGFRDLPDSSGEARDLILWRVARELRKPPESLACASQVERVEGEETRVLVRMVDRVLLDSVTDAAAAYGFFASRIDGWSGFAMNQATKAQAGARIWANDDWWALMCWARLQPEDPSECETLVHAEWRDAETSPGSVADKVSRIVKSFTLSSGAERLSVDLDLPEPLADTVRGILGRSETPLVLDDMSAGLAGGATCVALGTS